MNTKKIIMALAAAALMLPAVAQTRIPNKAEARALAEQYGNTPGLAVAGSTDQANLPQTARDFLNKHYKNVAVIKVEREFLDNSYEVDLANGVEMEFNAAGQITSIDTADGMALKESVVKDILPSEAYRQLKKVHQEKNVDEIEFKNGRLYEIGTIAYTGNDYTFDIQQNIFRVD